MADKPSFYGDLSGNASTADKLLNAHTLNGVAFDGSKDTTGTFTSGLYDGYLTWGGQARVSQVGPTDAGLCSIFASNKAQFSNPAGVTIEYSNNGGSTWTDYGATDENKINLLLERPAQTTLNIGKKTSAKATIQDQLRVTVNAHTCGFYTRLKKILINCSTNGASNCQVKIEKALGDASTTFTEVSTNTIAGWSGWNSIPVDIQLGGNDSQTSNVWVLRFTFTIGGVSTTSNSNLSIYNILFYGNTGWTTPSTMANTGHLYSYDTNQNAFFPGQVVTQVAGDAYFKATNTSNGKYTLLNTYNDKTGVYINNGSAQWLISYDGSKTNIMGNPYHQIDSGTATPSSSLGSNGDVYIKYNA